MVKVNEVQLLYARQRNNRCSLYFKEVTKEYLEKENKLYMCFVDL